MLQWSIHQELPYLWLVKALPDTDCWGCRKAELLSKLSSADMKRADEQLQEIAQMMSLVLLGFGVTSPYKRQRVKTSQLRGPP